MSRAMSASCDRHLEGAAMSKPRLLVVDDEPALTDLYAEWLSDAYRVDTAYDGEQALDAIDEALDVVLLDRRMPDRSGDEVLAEIRDRGVDCMVVMVSAVAPDFDVLEMEFDTYLKKPVSQDDLHEVVERMLARAGYEDDLREYFMLVSKQATLEASAGVGTHDRTHHLESRIAALKRQLCDELSEFNDRDFRSVFGSLASDQG